MKELLINKRSKPTSAEYKTLCAQLSDTSVLIDRLDRTDVQYEIILETYFDSFSWKTKRRLEVYVIDDEDNRERLRVGSSVTNFEHFKRSYSWLLGYIEAYDLYKRG